MFSPQIYREIFVNHRYTGGFTYFALHIVHATFCIEPRTREKSEDAVKQMLNDEIMFDSFINRGKSEIRWGNDGNKLNHFELIKNIRVEFQEIVDGIINNVISLYDENKIRDIIFYIDKELPDDLREEYGLSSYRKELIFKLIKERILRLKNIIL